jgi:hypothetical protein
MASLEEKAGRSSTRPADGAQAPAQPGSTSGAPRLEAGSSVASEQPVVRRAGGAPRSRPENGLRIWSQDGTTAAAGSAAPAPSRTGGPGWSGATIPSTRSGSSSGSGRSGGGKGSRRSGRKRKSRRRSWGRRILIWSLLLVVAGIIAFAAIVVNAYYHAYNAYSSLKQVPALVTEARKQLEVGQIPKGGVLDRATDLVGDAQAEIDNAGWPFRWVKGLPYLGRPVLAISLATDAAGKEAQAATIVNDLIGKILGPDSGAAGSQPPVFHDGVVDVALIKSVAPRLDQLVQSLRSADASIRAIPDVPFVNNLNDLKARVMSESSNAVRLAERAKASFALLPPLLGGDRPKTYYLALQNPSDQRGTGGAVLAYAVMRLDNGRISLANPLPGPIIGIDPSKSGFAAPVTPAATWYLRETGVVHRLANSVNYSPDFPSAARSWGNMLESGKTPLVQRVDGVIALDPYSVAAALHGQTIRLKDLGLSISASEIPKFVSHDQYLLSRAVQRAVPGVLIGEAFKAITRPTHLVSLLHNLSGTLTAKHIQVWMADPRIQSTVAELGWDGAIRNAADGDYLNLAYEKRIGNKVDYYLQEAVDYDVSVNASGGVTSTYALDLRLPVPPGQPASIVGTGSPYAADLAMTNLYVPQRAHLLSYSPTGAFGPILDHKGRDRVAHVMPKSFLQHIEGPFRVFTNTVPASPGAPGSVRYRYTVPRVVKTTPEGKVYTLTVQHQPMINAQRLVVHVHLPKGSEIVSLGNGWTPSGDGATYRGVVTKDFTTSIVFQ